jgi:hypothetical protein
MRHLALVVVVGTAVAGDQVATTEAFRRGGTYYLMALEDGDTPRCEAWTIVPAGLGNNGELQGTIEHDAIQLPYRAYDKDVDACLGGWVYEQPLAITVGGSVWFRDAATCQLAIDRHRPYATDVWPCTRGPDDATTRARFETIVLHGGTTYRSYFEPCEPVTWIADPDDPIGGVRFTSDDRARYSYLGSRLATNTTYEDHHTEVRDESLRFERDHVEVYGQSHYFTREACEAGRALDHRRRAWQGR